MQRAHHTILEQSRKDLQDDFAELGYLFTSLIQSLQIFDKQLQRTKKYLDSESLGIITKQQKNLQTAIEGTVEKIQLIAVRIPHTKPTETNIQFLAKEKAQYYDLLRTYTALSSSLITATDWQSPSFLHALRSQAGRYTGKILGTINDYKRDKHFDEEAYQKAFMKEYVDGRLRLPIPALLTNSGMAAFSTILNFLQMEHRDGPIIIGKAIYFENKELVKKIFADQVIEVDELDTNSVVRTIYSTKPSIVILDSLCNAATVPVPNIDAIVKALKKNPHDVYLVIDNTCLSVTLQPLPLVLARTRKVHLIVFESLNKYHQFGMDKITAGIIWGWGKHVGKLFSVREHSGTNITDTSCYVLPPPNRILLTKRLARFQRNTSFVAQSLQKQLYASRKTKFEKIIYPGLSNHPSYEWTKNLPFQGSYFSIRFKDKYRSTKYYQRFLKKVINEAKKQRVQMTAGTSFGFNTTRIYLTSLRSDFGEPFIRVSLGTENRLELEKIKDIFLNVLNSF